MGTVAKRILVGSLAACFVLPVVRAAAPAPEVTALGDYILANQAASPYGSDVRFPTRWCSDTAVDFGLNLWDYVQPLTDEHNLAQVWNAFAIPFFYQEYADNGAPLPPSAGAILVGFETAGNTAPAPNVPVVHAARPCELGEEIADRAPYPITWLPAAAEIAGLTMIDPAPEYRWWQMSDQTRHTTITQRVRVVQRIPVTYSMNGQDVTGFVVVGFGERPR